MIEKVDTGYRWGPAINEGWVKANIEMSFRVRNYDDCAKVQRMLDALILHTDEWIQSNIDEETLDKVEMEAKE